MNCVIYLTVIQRVSMFMYFFSQRRNEKAQFDVHSVINCTVLEFALENGIHVNVDNYQELERITTIINDQG